MQPKNFSNKVIKWFEHNGRHDLPWQKRPTPYRVWISEIMLQQTQVSTVIPYFQAFMRRFPSLKSLALAKQDEVLAHWSGLGYYARARNLHQTAQIIYETYHSRFPKTVEELNALPGIGRSTAGAILSLSMQLSAPILDGNVKRVLTRFHAIEGWPGNKQVENQLWEIAEYFTPKQNTHHYNQAMMDLGATLCTRTQANCSACPLQRSCKAYALNRVNDFPGKKPKTIRPKRQTYFLILRNVNGEILLEKRPPTGIWGGLWSFPQCDSLDETLKLSTNHTVYESVFHQFSHFELEIRPVLIDIVQNSSCVMESGPRVWYNFSDALPGGVAKPVRFLLEQLQHEAIT